MKYLFFAEQLDELVRVRECSREEAEAELIKSLGKGDRIAEGIPATLPEWGRYTGDGAMRKAIAHQRIPDGFWLDDSSSDDPYHDDMYSLTVFGDLGSAFIGLDGYIHIRIPRHDTIQTLRPDASKLTSSVKRSAALDKAIGETIEEVGKPPGRIGWKVFCDKVRSKLGKDLGVRGYGDRTIGRRVNVLEGQT